jgi:hypothetical protein
VTGVIDVQDRGVPVKLLELDEMQANEFLVDGSQARLRITVDLSRGQDDPDAVKISRNRNEAARMLQFDDAEDAKQSFIECVRYAYWLDNQIERKPKFFGIVVMDEQEVGPVPPLEGGSLFGPTILIVLKNMCLKHPIDRTWLASQMPAIRGTQLDRVAVSAAFDPASGYFATVTCVASKIKALEQLREPPAILVLPKANETRGGVPACTFKIIYCSDPASAFDELFSRQALDAFFDPRSPKR